LAEWMKIAIIIAFTCKQPSVVVLEYKRICF